MEKKKIIVITNDMEIGGVQRMLVGLLKALDRKRFEPYVALVCAGGPLAGELESLGVEVARFDCIRRTRLGKWIDPVMVLRLAFWMRKKRFDVCHTHLFLGNLVGRVAALLARCPVIISTEHNTYINKGAVARGIDRLLARSTCTIVAVSAAVADFTSAQESIPRGRFTVIHNGIDTSFFDVIPMDGRALRERIGIPRDHFVVGSVGRLVEQKGYPLVLEIFRDFLSGHPQSFLVIVGDGDRRGDLEKKAADLKIQDKVFFAGYQLDIRPWLSIFDIYLTTPFHEGLAMVFPEAMVSGVPVVTTRFPGICEVIEDGVTGILIDGRAPGPYAAALSSLLGDRRRMAELASRAKRRALERFTIGRMAGEYEALYDGRF